MEITLMLSKICAAAIVLSVVFQQCACEDVNNNVNKQSPQLYSPSRESRARLALYPGIVPAVVPRARSAVVLDSMDHIDNAEIESESRKHGIKIKKKKPKLKKSKKILKKILPFLLIPLLIQAKLIPLFLFKLKLIALKAIGIGKLALLLIAINVIYNTVHGAQTSEQQYNTEVLANENYGYNGGTEYGAWINRRYAQNP